MINDKTSREAAVCHALGHPIRLAIVKGLSLHECNVNKIVKSLAVPQSTISQHLGVLKAAKIIRGERRGVKICYQVIDPLVRKILSSL